MRKADYADYGQMKAPLVPVTLAFLSGILLGTYARLPPVSLVVVGAVSAGVALWRWRRARFGVMVLLLLWGCLGALRMAVWERHPDARLKALLADEPQPVTLHGIVVDDPVEFFEPGEAHVPDEGEAAAHADRQVCVVELRHRQRPQGWQPISGRVRATIFSPRALVRYGDEILVDGQWSRVPAPGNPGQYDWRASLARSHIHGLFRARPADGIVIVQSHRGHPLLEAVFHLRARWEALIRQTFNERDAGLLVSLLLGQRVALDEELKDAFVETGTIHLLVISGFNVGLVAGVLELFLRVFGLPWRLRLLLLWVGVGGYCLLTGMQPPVVRATLMAWVVIGACALDRVISWPNTLAAAALLILLLQPVQLFDPGFQLSFGAVASLFVFTGRWQSWLKARLAWLRPGWLRRYVALSLCATSAVWVGLAPVLAAYFHLVSPVSMLANLLLAPLLSVLISVGTACLMLGTICAEIMRWSSGPLTWVLRATLRSVSWCHEIPGGYWFVGHPPPWFLIGYYVLVGLSVLRAPWRLSPARLLLCWAAALTVWLWSLVARGAWESNWLRIDVLDVGHGDSIVVRTPRGRTFVVDGGTPEAGRFRVIPFLRFAGIGVLDAVVATHTDADHMGGAIPLLQEMAVRRLLTNGVRDDTMSARLLRRVAAARGIPEVVLASGMRLAGEPGLDIEVLHPPPGFVPGTAPESNDNSLVLKVTKGSVSVLLAADIEEAGLPWLMRESEALPSTVMKVPHHGSRLGQAGEQLFNAVRPRIAILSVGRLHHLPSAETIEALRRIGVRILSTREDGAIHLRTDGERLEVRTFKSKLYEITNNQIPRSNQ